MTDLVPAPTSPRTSSTTVRREEGRVFLSGVQALAGSRSTVAHRSRNGSPPRRSSRLPGLAVATFQEDASAAAATVPDLPIIVRPGLNEELARRP
jgi:hypothetical protein